MHKILFYNKFISCLHMFRAPYAHRQEVKLYYTASGIIKPIVYWFVSRGYSGRGVKSTPIGVMIPEAV